MPAQLYGAVLSGLAAGLLGVVTFSVPYLKPFFFIKASFFHGKFNGSIVLGTLGYCLETVEHVRNCTKPSFVYNLGNSTIPGYNSTLLDNNLPDQLPQLANKWVINFLALHIIAAVMATLSIFAFLSTIPNIGTASAIVAALFAAGGFGLDLALFFVSRHKRTPTVTSDPSASTSVTVPSISVTSVAIGYYTPWFTLLAFIFLSFAGIYHFPKKKA